MSFSSHHLYFDDLQLNQEWDSPGRTITEADIVNYAGFSGDFNPMHMNDEFAKATPFRRRIAHGFGVFSIASGLGVQNPQVRIIALTSVRAWTFLLPVFIGDTIHLHTRCMEKTLRGRGKRGEVVWNRSIRNQDNKVVQDGEIITLVECRPLARPGESAAADAHATV